jgi:synaptobrevin
MIRHLIMYVYTYVLTRIFIFRKQASMLCNMITINLNNVLPNGSVKYKPEYIYCTVRNWIIKDQMSAKTNEKQEKLYSIAIFLEDIIPTESIQNIQTDQPMSLEDYESYVDENGEYNQSQRDQDDLGNRLRLLGFLTDTSAVSFIGKNMFKEFLLAGLRQIAGAHQPRGLHRRVDTYEFDSPKGDLTYAVYVSTRDMIDRVMHHRLIVMVATSDGYPKRLKMAVSDKLLDYIAPILSTSKGAYTRQIAERLDRKIMAVIKEYYLPQNVDNIGSMRSGLDDTKEVMRDNVEKLLARGDQIDDLVERSADLSTKSKTFYKTSKRLNQNCCIIV